MINNTQVKPYCCCVASASCPESCTYSMSEGVYTIVDCANRKITQLPPHLPSDTAELILHGNNIRNLSAKDLTGCTRLRYLQLSDNQLETLDANSLTSVNSLRKLVLNGNRLQYNLLPTEIFDKLVNLTELYLHNNLRTNPIKYPKNWFRDLITRLEILSIDAPSDGQFGEDFASLKKLTGLRIYRQLTSVKNNTFAVFTALPIMELSLKTGNSLNALEPMSFAHFSMLRTLDLSYNQGLGFDTISCGWWGLQFTNITKLILTRIAPHDEQSAHVKAKFFDFLNLTHITDLVIS
jgi:Leucine-rich repeat (LRR) protein